MKLHNKILTGVGLKKKKSKIEKVGKPPGTLIYFGEREDQKTKIIFTEYSENNYNSREAKSFEELKALYEKSNAENKWINIIGIGDIELLKKFGTYFKIHELTLEDILNIEQRPKLDSYENYIYLALRRINLNNEKCAQYEQISLIIGVDYLISFQDERNDFYSGVYERIKTGLNVFRHSPPDYLFYVLIDIIVDNYFLITEEVFEYVENLRSEILEDPSKEKLEQAQSLKKELHSIRTKVSPLREIIANLDRNNRKFISENAAIYLKDTHDHVVEIVDLMDTFLDSTTSLLDLYFSSLSHRMNEVMKVLTVIATIFIPLTFIVGIYGMNFSNMPELEWKYGYPTIMTIMFVIGLSLFVYFKRKDWI